MARMSKDEWDAQQARAQECQRKHALLRSVLAQLESEIWTMDGGVHSVGTRANPEAGKEDDWCIVIGVRKRTNTFNNELGVLRHIVAKLLKRTDTKDTVIAYEEEPPARPDTDRS
jgi:hypothetical protein